MSCSGITQGASWDCQNPLKSSVNERLLLGNLDDIDTVAFDSTGSIVESIVMKSGKQMFPFQGVRSSNKPEVGLVSDDVSIGFMHQIDFSIFEVDSAQKLNIQAMAARRQFAIYQNPKDSSLGDAVFEVLGIHSGLEMSQLSRLPATKDGSYKVQLKTSENASETGLPNSFWKTDLPTTEAAIEELLSPQTP